MPTKHKRHAITETPRVKQALDPLRTELNGQRLDLAELVVLGAETKLAQMRGEREQRDAALTRLADKLRNGELHLDPELADEAKRIGLPR
ncbi:MAG: hypothetical protein ACR2LH_05680 [Thermoleophilaceae bacterium]